uniref:RING-type E3 ubiquitin transferase n=1 Tax=Oryza punctata TaxID=4537 RepID=A0A0E0MAD7_ORYPU
MATAPHARRLAAADGPLATPAVGPASGGRPQFNLSSGAATAVVFVSIVLCFILLCTYCRCARQRAIAGARSRVMREIRERVPGVLLLRPTAGAALPVLPYSATAAAAGAKKGPLVEDCPVCLEAFADDDGVKVVPACGHVFHAACIDQWLAVRNSCPVCRCAVVCYYADRARDTAVVVDDDEDDQEVVLERVVAMIEAIREEQREEEAAARRAPASGGGGLMTS